MAGCSTTRGSVPAAQQFAFDAVNRKLQEREAYLVLRCSRTQRGFDARLSPDSVMWKDPEHDAPMSISRAEVEVILIRKPKLLARLTGAGIGLLIDLLVEDPGRRGLLVASVGFGALLGGMLATDLSEIYRNPVAPDCPTGPGWVRFGPLQNQASLHRLGDEVRPFRENNHPSNETMSLGFLSR